MTRGLDSASPEKRAVWGPINVSRFTIAPGETRDLWLPVAGESTPLPSEIPVRVVHGTEAGPTLFVIAGLHGDELNGLGIVRRLMMDCDLSRIRGTLFLVPIANVYGFYEHTRYLPDGRDLNRCFPGNPHGSFGSRLAATIFEEIVRRSSAGIDLHTAPRWRSNVPHVRVDAKMPEALALARAFGEEIVVHDSLKEGTLRAAAGNCGIPVLLFEVGEPFGFQPVAIERGVRGVRSVLRTLQMVEGRTTRPLYRVILKNAHWIRAEQSGVLEMKVSPGDLLLAGAVVTATTDPFGGERSAQISPYTGLVLGVTTHPSVKPGDPLCHVGRVKRSLSLLERHLGPPKCRENATKNEERNGSDRS